MNKPVTARKDSITGQHDTTPRQTKNPPGPASNWWWAWMMFPNLYLMQTKPVNYMQKIAHKYGDICTYLMATQRGYIVNNPRLIKDLLAREKSDYQKAEWQMKALRKVVGDGLLTSSGDLWRRQRRLVQSVFRMDSLPKYGDIATRLTEQHTQKWADSSELDLMKELSELSMTISIRTNLGAEEGVNSSTIAQKILNVGEDLRRDMESICSLPEWLPIPSNHRKRADRKYLIDYVDNAIVRKRQEGPNSEFDLLYKLLEAVDAEGDGGEMTPELVRDEAITMMIAGNHSVSATLGWVWALLLNHDDVFERVEREVLEVLGDRNPEFEDVMRLPYLKQVLQESLRLYPSAWVLFCREAKQETYLGPHPIRKGGWVFVVPFVTHRDPRFFPDPLKFDPDRFSEERIDEIPQDAYFPFGAGSHICIGKHLAMTQITLMIAMIIKNFSISPLAVRPSLEISRDLAVRPKNGCPALIKRRPVASKMP